MPPAETLDTNSGMTRKEIMELVEQHEQKMRRRILGAERRIKQDLAVIVRDAIDNHPSLMSIRDGAQSMLLVNYELVGDPKMGKMGFMQEVRESLVGVDSRLNTIDKRERLHHLANVKRFRKAFRHQGAMRAALDYLISRGEDGKPRYVAIFALLSATAPFFVWAGFWAENHFPMAFLWIKKHL